jgi:3-dehydroquinate dehydratase-2
MSVAESADPRVLVLNGPNLGRLGTREPEQYGTTSYAELEQLCVQGGAELGLAVTVRQSEHEGELLGWLHEAADAGTPVVLNAGALTHTSVALGDACAMLTAELVEVHISNVHRREEFRQHSYVSAHADGVIVGLGVEGYVLALSWLSSRRAAPAESREADRTATGGARADADTPS